MPPIFVPAIVAGLAGIWAVGVLNRSPRRERPDRRVAIKLAVGLGLLVTAVVAIMLIRAVVGAGVAPAMPLVVLFAGGIGLAIALSGLVGYAVLARPRVGGIAILGVLAGPLVLAASWLVVLDA